MNVTNPPTLPPNTGDTDIELLTILCDYSDDLAALKKRDGDLPTQAAVKRIQAAIEHKLNEARVDENNWAINEARIDIGKTDAPNINVCLKAIIKTHEDRIKALQVEEKHNG